MRTRTILLSTIAGLATWAHGQDFNGNAVRDSVDIRNGTSPDCDRNGVPDVLPHGTPLFAAAIEHHSDTATLTNVSSSVGFDVDLDGDTDVIVSSRTGTNDSNLTIWRNDGGPGLTFATRITVTNAFCYTLRTGDLNGDGRTDIVAADAGFAQVVVLLANGAGSFAAPTRLVAGSRSTGLALADLDNDGDTDIVTAGVATNTAEIFRNNGNGTFAPRQSVAASQQPTAVAAGDFTGDGLADLAVANSFISAPGTGTVTLLRGTGTSFVAHATITVAGHAETSSNSAPHDIALVDINADGDLDLLVSSKDSNSLRVYSNDGAGVFANTQTLGPLDAVGATSDRLVCTNLDLDTAPELAWCDSGARAVRVYDNVEGRFALAGSFGAGSMGPVGVTAADLTGDGLADLVLAGDSSSAFSTLESRGGLDFAGATHIRRTDLGYTPLLADFTGDGVVDLATANTSGVPALFHVAPGSGDNRFGAPIVTTLPSAAPILPRDVDGDGDLDILSVGNSGVRYCVLNNGDGTFAPAIFSSPINVNGSFQTADINNDGHLDSLWTRSIASNEPAFIAISLGDGAGHFGTPYEITTPAFLGSVWTGDLSGDGAPEIFAGVGNGLGTPGMEAFVIYPNNGDGTFGAYTPVASDLAPNFAGSVGAFAWEDMDGDGDRDLLAVSNGVWLFRNTNNQLAAPVPAGGFANYWINEFGPAVVDMDADGDLDFVGSASVNGASSPTVFLNDGTGNFSQRLSLMRYRNTTDAFSIGDTNSDGRPDVLVRASGFSDFYLHGSSSLTADCNGNNHPDACDIASGSSLDANANGVPDECELPMGVTADSTSTCPGGTIALGATAHAGAAYVWQIAAADAGAGFVTVVDGVYTEPVSGRTLTVAGAGTSTVTLSALLPGITSSSIRVRCVASTSAAQGTSAPVTLRACIADFTCDGGVDSDDTIAFFNRWDSAAPDADVDGNGDIDGDDVITFFAAWDAGC